MKIAEKKSMNKIAALFALIVLPASMLLGQDNGNVKVGSINVEMAEDPAVVIGGVRISLGDAIKQAIQKNHDILSGSYDVAMTDTYYEQLQKKYAVYLAADAGYKYTKNAESTAFLYGKDSTTIDGNIALQKSFVSGTKVSLGMNNSYTDKTLMNAQIPVFDAAGNRTDSYIPFSLGVGQYYMPVFFASVQQELLQNGFGYNDRRQNQIAKNSSKMQKDTVLQALSMVVVGVIVDYWNVVTCRTEMDNSELQLAETRKVRNIIQRNVNLGLVDGFQVNYYNLLVAGAEANVIGARQKYKTAVRDFLTTINMDENTDLAGRVILCNKVEAVNEEVALKAAFDKRADYSAARLSLENARMEMEMTDSEGLPSLKAELNVSTLGMDKALGTSYGDAASFSYPTIEGRVRLSHPLDDSAQKVSERNARFKVKQAEISLDKVKRSVRDDIKNKAEYISTAYNTYTKAREARGQAELFYYKMLANLQKGRLDSATVKNGLDAMVNSRQSEIQALVYYNITLLQFTVAKNELWEKYGIVVDDYIPRDKK